MSGSLVFVEQSISPLVQPAMESTHWGNPSSDQTKTSKQSTIRASPTQTHPNYLRLQNKERRTYVDLNVPLIAPAVLAVQIQMIVRSSPMRFCMRVNTLVCVHEVLSFTQLLITLHHRQQGYRRSCCKFSHSRFQLVCGTMD